MANFIIPTLIWPQHKGSGVGSFPFSIGVCRFIFETARYVHQIGHASSLDLSDLRKRDQFWVWDPGKYDCDTSVNGKKLWSPVIPLHIGVIVCAMKMWFIVKISNEVVGVRCIIGWNYTSSKPKILMQTRTTIRTNWYWVVKIPKLFSKSNGFFICDVEFQPKNASTAYISHSSRMVYEEGIYK